MGSTRSFRAADTMNARGPREYTARCWRCTEGRKSRQRIQSPHCFREKDCCYQHLNERHTTEHLVTRLLRCLSKEKVLMREADVETFSAIRPTKWVVCPLH